MRKIVQFLKNESGATAIEYGLIAAGIAVAIIAVVNGLGTQLQRDVHVGLDAAEVKSTRSNVAQRPPGRRPLFLQAKLSAPGCVSRAVRRVIARRLRGGSLCDGVCSAASVLLVRAAGRERRVRQQQLPDLFHIGAGFAGTAWP